MRDVFEPGDEVAGGALLDYWYDHVWAEHIDYRSIEGAIDDVGPIRGRDAMLRYATDWLETIEDFRMEPAEVIEASGETFVVVLRLTGTARGSARRVSQQLPVVWTFRNDKLVYGREYSTRDEALRAAGLSDPPD